MQTITADNGVEFSEISDLEMKLCLFILLDLILLGNVGQTKGIMVYIPKGMPINTPLSGEKQYKKD